MFNNELWQKPAGGAGGSNFYDYQIAKSFRWQSGYLKRTPSYAGNRQTWTFSCWIKASGVNQNTSGDVQILNAGTSGNQDTKFRMYFYNEQLYSSSNEANYNTSPGFYRDPNAWYHIVWKLTGGTSYQYVNGSLASTSSVSGNVAVNNNIEHLLGIPTNLATATKLTGYMAEVVFIDGTALDPTSFAETKNGAWIPKDPSTLTFGTNGYHLDFADASAPGNDVSGNNNDWINVSLATNDQMLDTPTFNSNSNGGNFATLGVLWKTPNMAFTEGNLRYTTNDNQRGCMSNWAIPIGSKVYWEHTQVSWAGSNGDDAYMGINQAIVDFTADRGGTPTSYSYSYNAGNKMILGTSTSYGAAIRTGDVVGVAVDRVNHTIQFYKNGVAQGTFSISATMELYPWFGSGGGFSSAVGAVNFGADSTFSGAPSLVGTSANAPDSTGYGDFYDTPPTGFLAMCAGNLPTADAIDPAQTDDDFPQELFFMSQYTGNGTNRTITTANQPDLMFLRHYTTGQDWYTFDSTRVITDNKVIITNTTAAESVLPQGNVTSVGATSVGINSSSWLNSGGSYYQMWMWRANGGSLTTNNVGTQTSYTQTDPSGGFSITKYVGTGSAMTIGHGLSVEPKLTIIKDLDSAVDWVVYTKAIDGSMDYFLFNTDAAKGDSGLTGPNASIWNFNSASGYSNTNGRNYIMYNFANIDGYCKVGTYVGNADADGTFVYTGFKPAYILNKPIVAGNWRQQDIARSLYNVSQSALSNNNNTAEDTGASVAIDTLSNGFKMRNSSTPWNQATTYLYLAFAENPFKYATAR